MNEYLNVSSIKNDKFLAKPNESLNEHTTKVIGVANQLFEIYGSLFSDNEKELLFIACQVHDYGKINELFQKKLKSKMFVKDEIYHNFLSPLFLNIKKLLTKYSEEECKDLITAIYHHHTRDNSVTRLDKYFDLYLKNNIRECFDMEMSYSGLYERYLWFCIPNNGHSLPCWESYAKLKGLLNKCDYAASAGIENLEVYDKEKRQKFLEQIKNRFPKGLNSLQIYMDDNHDKNLVLIAPTGSGKTEGSFLWIRESKAFYTLPLKVAANAIYKRAISNYGYDEAAILHSDALQIMVNDNIEDRYEITKFLGYPLTITTVDQLFKFAFKAVGHEILFATLTYAKVIIDEIQMYSSTVLACLLVGLGLLTKQGGKFAITTATLPPLFLDYLDKYVGKNYQREAFYDGVIENRHRLKIYESDFDYELILNQSNTSKVLVICNTVKRAQQVFEELKQNTDNIFLLHSRFIRMDKEEKETMILNCAQACIWVTTQVVEASLDIDFDFLHTDLSTADSLFQRMGRCYRRREYKSEEANINIYDSKVGIQRNERGIYDENIYNMTLLEIKKYDNKYISEKEKQDIIKNIYNESALEGSKYLNDLKKKLKIIEDSYPAQIEKIEADKMFRDIKQYTVIPEELYEANKEEIYNLQKLYENSKGLERMKIRNKLMEFTVSVPTYMGESVSGIVIQKQISRLSLKYTKELGVIDEKYVNQY